MWIHRYLLDHSYSPTTEISNQDLAVLRNGFRLWYALRCFFFGCLFCTGTHTKGQYNTQADTEFSFLHTPCPPIYMIRYCIHVPLRYRHTNKMERNSQSIPIAIQTPITPISNTSPNKTALPRRKMIMDKIPAYIVNFTSPAARMALGRMKEVGCSSNANRLCKMTSR